MPSPWTDATPQRRPVALLDGPLWPALTPADAETVRGLLRAEQEYNPEAPALISGAIFAGLSLAASSLLAVALGQRGTTAGLWTVAVGTVLGAAVGGWWVQPRIARVLERAREPRGSEDSP